MKEIKVALPKGTKDYDGVEIKIIDDIICILKKIFDNYGAEQISTPIIEKISLVQNAYGDEFNKSVFKLEGGKHFLRYDLTLPGARYVGNKGYIKFKKYSVGDVFRRDDCNIEKGRLRIFKQADFDIYSVNINDFIEELEILQLLYTSINKLLEGEKFKIKINHRVILYNMLTSCGVTDENFKTVCSTIDKMDKNTEKEIETELINKTDPSTAFKILDLFKQFKNKDLNNLEIIRNLQLNGFINDILNQQFGFLFNSLEKFGIADKFEFDISMVRGLDYYSGIIFEVNYWDKNIMPFSIAGGGRYNIVNKYSNHDIQAIGLSIGIDRILTIVKSFNVCNENNPIIYLASINENSVVEKLKIAQELRDNNIKVDYNYGKNTKIGCQLQHVLENNLKYMLIIGDDEIKYDYVIVKDIDKKIQYKFDRKNYIENIKKLFI